MDKIKLYEKHMGELQIFEVIDSILVNKSLIIKYKNPLYLVSYRHAKDGLHGDVEPIGLFNYAGSRKYLWRDEYYKDSSTNVDVTKVVKILSTIKKKTIIKDSDQQVLEYLNKIILYSSMVFVKPVIYSWQTRLMKDQTTHLTYVSKLSKQEVVQD